MDKQQENTSEQALQYWKSYESFANREEINEQIEKEFMSSPLAEDDGKDGWARREFLKLMGASLALSSFGCIRRPQQRIVPYAKAPLEIIPGIPNYYTSSVVMGGEGYGLLIKTREGRPLKLEGNPDHPVNQGALSARAHAFLLSLYDPDRLQKPMKVDRATGSASDVTWEAIDEAVLKSLSEGECAVLTPSLASPATSQVIGDFLQAFRGRHVTWDALAPESVLAANEASYGRRVFPRYSFDRARMIVSIDCDFLATYGSPVEYAKGFSKARKPGPDMATFVAFESIMTTTGASADTRVRIKPSQQLEVVLGLLHALTSKGRTRFASGAIADLAKRGGGIAERLGTIEPKLFEKIADDLWENRGKSIVIAGGLPTETAGGYALQLAVNLLNSALDNDGKTIDGTSVVNRAQAGSYSDLARLITDMKAGKISTLIIHRVNPVYALPESSGFHEALKNVKTIVYTGDHLDETAKRSDFVAPDVHELENWGDSELQTGVLSIQQPVIRPMYDNSPFQFTLMNWASVAKKGPERLRQDSWYKYFEKTWSDRNTGGKFDDFWTKSLQTGVVDSNSSVRTRDTAARNFNGGVVRDIEAGLGKGSDLELVLYPTVQMGDGTLANIAWLQELPDSISKITWDSYLAVSPKYAEANNLKMGDVVDVTANGQKISAPVHVQPGLHDQVVALQVGYGRTDAGAVGSGIGFNSFKLANFNNGKPVFSGLPVQVTKTGEGYQLACVQDHHHMEGRQIIAQATLAAYLKKKNAGIHPMHTEKVSVWKKHEYKGYRWGMSVDHNACIGCSACVTACQSENNIPVIGKKFVLQGREMHWIRIDRYYSAAADTKGLVKGKYDLSNPDVLFQPMLCQHCENAPCETVCPVAATVHDDQGLNTMIYNRCVGTRYCSNNCPYKVRRFNWFNYNIPEHPYTLSQKPLNKALNPQVTVRFRGVMEKCTFCIQRIDDAKNTSRNENRQVRDGEIKTACEQTCPTNAITFGDMNDPNSRVSNLFKDERTYMVLEEYNTEPSVRYMTRIRNADRPDDTHGAGGSGHEGAANHGTGGSQNHAAPQGGGHK